ncbi:Conjugal transfer protein TraG [Vibrio crassostreae]|nr:Conjugal transfer protein TraG [Vibrio crassostreae]
MNKFLMFFILLFSVNVHASTLEESTGECKSAIELANSIGEFSENNLGAQSYRSCGFMLMPEDANLIIALAPIATPEIVKHYSDIIKAIGGNSELISEHMDSRSTLVAWILDLSQYSQYFGALFFFIAIWGLFRFSDVSPTIILRTIFVIVIAIGISKFDKAYTYMSIKYVGATNQILWNAADHKQIEKLGEDPLTDLAPAIQKNSTIMSQLFHYVETINIVSNNEAFHELWGDDIEIDTTYNKWGFDIKNPTVAEALDYINECSYTDYAIVDNETSFHIKNLNFSSIVTEVEFNSGGETKNYNCHPSHYGNKTIIANLIFNTPNLIKNFMLENFSTYMGTDLTWKDEFETMGNKLVGTLMLEIEKAEDTAATNPEIISEQLQMAQDAAEEARLTGVAYTKTDSYLELVEMHKLKMGDIFDHKEIEGLTSIANIAYRGISLNHYNGAEWFSLSGDKDSIVPKKRMMGYHILQPYIRTTINLELESQCAKTNGAGFETRDEFATRFNNSIIKNADTVKFKDAGTFGLKNDTHCYRFNDDGSVVAGGYYKTVDELDSIITDRLRSVDIYQASRNQAGLDLILGDEELDKSLQLEALNSLSPTFTDAMKSYTVLTDSKQEIAGALSSLQDAMEYDSLVNYNTNLPQYYFNFKKFHTNGKSKTLEADALSRELQKYDLSNFFEVNSLSFVEDARALQKNAEGTVAKMVRNECPLYVDGKCRANLLALNMSSYSHMYEQTKFLMMYEKGVALGSGICDTVDKGFENTLGGVFGKVRYVTPIGIGCAVMNLANAGNEVFIKPIEVLSFIATVFSFVMSLVPVLLDLLRMYAPYLLFIVPAVLISVMFWVDMIVGMTRFVFFSQHTEKDFLEAIEFRNTFKACQSVVVSFGASLFIYFMITSLLTSGMIGGATYDNVWSGYNKTFIESISRSFITVFVIGVQIWYIAIPLSRRVWSQIMDITNTKGQNFDNDFENFAKSLMLGFGMGAVAQFKAMNNGIDKSLNNLVTSESDSKETPPATTTDKEAQANKQTVDSDEDEKEDEDDVKVDNMDSKETSSSDKEEDDKHYPESRHYEFEGSPIVSKDNTQADIESKAKDAIEKIDDMLDSKK